MKFRAMGCMCALSLAACAIFAGTPAARAQEREHVVSSQDLHQDMQKAAQTRQANEATLRELFRSGAAQKALKSAHVDYQKVDNAVGQLSDEDLARLAERSRQVQKDFAAGTISDRELLVIVIIGVLIIALVAALH